EGQQPARLRIERAPAEEIGERRGRERHGDGQQRHDQDQFDQGEALVAADVVAADVVAADVVAADVRSGVQWAYEPIRLLTSATTSAAARSAMEGQAHRSIAVHRFWIVQLAITLSPPGGPVELRS